MRPNIFFLTIDSLRADKCTGNKKTSKTPYLDSLINDGIYFSQAIAASDQTGTSLASIFTGLNPTKSGLNQVNFSENTATYLDIFKKNGYISHCFVPDSQFFTVLASKFDYSTTYLFEKKESWLRLEGGLGTQIIEKIKSKKNKEPWIFYTHLMDIRPPFLVPEQFDNEKCGDTKYDRLVSSIDIWIGRILGELDLKKTLFVLTSDHGEYIPVMNETINQTTNFQRAIRKGTKSIPFLEKVGLKTILNIRFAKQTYKREILKRTLSPYQLRSLNTRATKYLYDELIHVPLIFKGYNLPDKRIFPDLVRHVDIFPTILEIAGIFNDDLNIDGRSLTPLISGEKIEEIPAYIEVGINLSQLLEKKNPKAEAKMVGIRTSKFKYIRSKNDQNQDSQLYDLKSDPLEEKNMSKEHPEIVKKMEETLTKIMQESKKKIETMTDEEIKKAKEILMNLGYL